MTDQDTSKQDRELAGWRLAFRLTTLFFLLLVGFVALSTTYRSARFEAIFAEMLGGQSLPMMTQFVFAQREILSVVFLVLTLGASAGVLFLKNRVAVVCIGFGTILLLLCGTVLVVAACFVPLISIIGELSG